MKTRLTSIVFASITATVVRSEVDIGLIAGNGGSGALLFAALGHVINLLGT